MPLGERVEGAGDVVEGVAPADGIVRLGVRAVHADLHLVDGRGDRVGTVGDPDAVAEQCHVEPMIAGGGHQREATLVQQGLTASEQSALASLLGEVCDELHPTTGGQLGSAIHPWARVGIAVRGLELTGTRQV